MFRCFLWVAAVAFFLAGCADQAEEQASQMYELAGKYAQDRQFDQAIKVLQSVRINYENTATAQRAEDEIAEYQKLQRLQNDNQMRKLTSSFHSIGRALENYKVRFLSYPLTREDISDKLPALVAPEWVDPWGRDIFYKPTYSSDAPRHAPDGYALGSFGADGLPGGTNQDQDHFYQNGQETDRIIGN